MTELSLRQLNRTLLLRQLLTKRTAMPAASLIEHLVAVQGQEPNWPYVGLWARLTDFRPDDLGTLLHERTVVRSNMIRQTVHLATAADFRWIQPTVQPQTGGWLRAPYYQEALAGIDRLNSLQPAGNCSPAVRSPAASWDANWASAFRPHIPDGSHKHLAA